MLTISDRLHIYRLWNIRSWNSVLTKFNNSAILSWSSWCLPLLFRKRKLPTTERRHAQSSYEGIYTHHNPIQLAVRVYVDHVCMFLEITALVTQVSARWQHRSSGAFRKSHTRHSRMENATNKIQCSFICLISRLRFYLCWQPPIKQVSWQATWISNQQHLRVT